MPLYTIYDTRSRPHEVTVESDSVLDAPLALDWSIGLPFPHLRNWCEAKGWIIVPHVPEPNRLEFSFGGSTYRIHLHHGHIEQVTRDGEGITVAEIPKEIRGVL